MGRALGGASGGAAGRASGGAVGRASGRDRARAALVALVLVAGTVGAAGCSSPPTCDPAPLTVQPTSVAPDGTATVSSGPAPCDLGDDARYELHLVSAWDDVVVGTTRVGRDGAFSVQVHVPADAAPGRWAVQVLGSAYDACDAGPGGDCASYGVRLTVVPPG